jgi:hypothetical protein
MCRLHGRGGAVCMQVSCQVHVTRRLPGGRDWGNGRHTDSGVTCPSRPARTRARPGRPGGAGRPVIRVLVAEDVRVARDTLVALLGLEADIEVAVAVASGDQIVPAALEHRPDVALLDIGLPGTDGLTAAAELAVRLPGCRVLILTRAGRLRSPGRGHARWGVRVPAQGQAGGRAYRRRAGGGPGRTGRRLAAGRPGVPAGGGPRAGSVAGPGPGGRGSGISARRSNRPPAWLTVSRPQRAPGWSD